MANYINMYDGTVALINSKVDKNNHTARLTIYRAFETFNKLISEAIFKRLAKKMAKLIFFLYE